MSSFFQKELPPILHLDSIVASNISDFYKIYFPKHLQQSSSKSLAQICMFFT